MYVYVCGGVRIVVVVCVFVRVWYEFACQSTHVEVRAQLTAVHLVLPLLPAQGLNSDHQPWQEVHFHCAVVAHAFNPSTWEAEAGGFLSSRPA